MAERSVLRNVARIGAELTAAAAVASGAAIGLAQIPDSHSTAYDSNLANRWQSVANLADECGHQSRFESCVKLKDLISSTDLEAAKTEHDKSRQKDEDSAQLATIMGGVIFLALGGGMMVIEADAAVNSITSRPRKQSSA